MCENVTYTNYLFFVDSNNSRKGSLAFERNVKENAVAGRTWRLVAKLDLDDPLAFMPRKEPQIGDIASNKAPANKICRLAPLTRVPTNWSKETPPPRGGFLFKIFPHKKPCVKGTPRRICTRFIEGGPLTYGSWWGNILIRKPLPPPGGGGSFDQNER